MRRDERGSVSIQMVVLMPVLFAIAFTGLQAGLYFYGRSAALAAATTGARAALDVVAPRWGPGSLAWFVEVSVAR